MLSYDLSPLSQPPAILSIRRLFACIKRVLNVQRIFENGEISFFIYFFFFFGKTNHELFIIVSIKEKLKVNFPSILLLCKIVRKRRGIVNI